MTALNSASIPGAHQGAEKTPKVSVAMSVHNGERFLRTAVESVLGQVFRDFEFIIVDDGSCDKTWSILSDSAKRDDRIALIRNGERIGLARSLNKAIRVARGAYLARFDADDICLPTRIGRQVQFLDSHPGVSLVGTGVWLVDEEGRRIRKQNNPVRSRAHFLFLLLQCQNWLYHPTVMARRCAIEQICGYDESISVAQDFDLFARLARKGHDARVIRDPLVSYRVHGSQVGAILGEAQLEQRRKTHLQLLSSYLGDIPVLPVKLFLSEQGNEWMWTSRRETRSFTRNLDTMLANIRKETGMADHDYSELRFLFSVLAIKAAIKAVALSRPASLAFTAFALTHAPRLAFSPWSACWALTYFAGPAFAKRLVRLTSPNRVSAGDDRCR